jgi:hypothetical protein
MLEASKTTERGVDHQPNPASRVRMRQVITERTASPEFADVPGGTTGLLTKTYVGKDAIMPVYRVETRILAELRAREKQFAEELGQWSEKREPTTNGAAALTSITAEFVRPGEMLRGWIKIAVFPEESMS